MSVEFWTAAEKFYETIYPVLGISICVFIIILIYGQMYARGKAKKIVTIISAIAMIGLIGYGAWGYQHYEEYLAKSKLVSPLIRDRHRGIFGYQYYGRADLDLYKRLHDTERLKELGLYEEKVFEEPISYLGKGRYFYYFEDKQEKVFKLSKGVRFEPNITEAVMVGEKFYLKNPQFTDIGFFNPERMMYDYIEIPEEQEGREYEPDFEPDVPQAQDYFSDWNF